MSKTFAIDSTTQPIQKTSTNPLTEDLQARIQLRAYELYEERGRVHGRHEQDWLDAEKQIREQTQLDRAA